MLNPAGAGARRDEPVSVSVNTAAVRVSPACDARRRTYRLDQFLVSIRMSTRVWRPRHQHYLSHVVAAAAVAYQRVVAVSRAPASVG